MSALHNKRRISFILYLVLGTTLTSGCTQQLRIVAQPDGCTVTLRNESGRALKTGPAPLEASVSAPNPTVNYLVEIAPPNNQVDQFVSARRTITAAEISQLPVVEGQVHELSVALDAQEQLRVVAQPGGSAITLRDDSGRTLTSGTAPFTTTVSSGTPSTNYLVDIAPPTDQADQFLPGRRAITFAQISQLPAVNGHVHELRVALEEKQFVTMPYVEIILDAQRHWRGLISQSRSFREITEMAGTVPTRIVDFDQRSGIQGLTLSPDGTRIVYSVASYAVQLPDLVSGALPVDEQTRIIPLRGSNLRGVSIASGGIQQITSEDFLDMFPAFTPDGKNLLYSSNRQRRELCDIFRVGAGDRTGITNIYINPNDAIAFKPTQAKDGTIAFVVYPDNASDPQIWTIGGKNGFPTQVAKGFEPSISPDGKSIAFIGLDENLWVINVDGSNQTQLTSSAARVRAAYEKSLNADEKQLYDWCRQRSIRQVQPFSFPSWSPDGQYVLWTGMEGNDNTGRPDEDIWIMRIDGTGKQQLTTNGSADRFPVMSPDSKYIYFMSNRGKGWAIWRIDAPKLESVPAAAARP